MFDINKCPKDKDGNLLAQTTDGRRVMLIITNGRGNQPLAGYIDDLDILHQWSLNGRYSNYEPHNQLDLINIPEPKRSGEVWVNIYAIESAMHFNGYTTEEQADYNALPKRIACVRVPWTEGEGLEGK